MHFDWDYAVSLLWDTDFWKACWVVVKLSTATWVVAWRRASCWRWESRRRIPS